MQAKPCTAEDDRNCCGRESRLADVKRCGRKIRKRCGSQNLANLAMGCECVSTLCVRSCVSQIGLSEAQGFTSVCDFQASLLNIPVLLTRTRCPAFAPVCSRQSRIGFWFRNGRRHFNLFDVLDLSFWPHFCLKTPQALL